jgi:hypothetical protein
VAVPDLHSRGLLPQREHCHPFTSHDMVVRESRCENLHLFYTMAEMALTQEERADARAQNARIAFTA